MFNSTLSVDVDKVGRYVTVVRPDSYIHTQDKDAICRQLTHQCRTALQRLKNVHSTLCTNLMSWKEQIRKNARMDFLEDRYLHHVRDARVLYRFRERRTDELLNSLHDREFQSNFRFSKERVREIAHILDSKLRYNISVYVGY